MSAISRLVALTFDAEHPDRPSEAGTCERLLEALDRDGVRATFFVQGRWAEAYPATARSIAGGGHLVGNHSHYHARMPLLTDAGLAEDVAEAGRVIEDATGVDPRPWFRCPFGAGADDARVQAAVSAAGYRHVGWDVAADDWEPARTGAMIAGDVVERVLAGGVRAVILLHTWPTGTLEAVPMIVRQLRDSGATFIGVDGLASVPTLPNWA